MKKTIKIAVGFLLVTAMFSVLFASCTKEVPERTKIKIAGLIGPTGLGMSKLMKDNDNKITENEYEFTLSASPEEIVGKVSNGDVDVAAVPTNMASVLYNKTNGKIQMAAINTLGVLYVLERGDSIKSVEDLKDKTVYMSGEGATPEFIFNFLLKHYGLNDEVITDYKEEHSAVVSLCVAGSADIVILPEPNVSNVLSKNSEYRIALDLTKEYEKACKEDGNEDSFLAMGCIIVNKEFADNNKEAFEAFLNEYKSSVEYVNANSDNKAAKLAVEYGIIPSEDIAKMAIPNCNITFITGNEMKDGISQFFKILFEATPQSVGGKLPADDFYYMP